MAEHYYDIGAASSLLVSSEAVERVLAARSADAALVLLYLMKERGRINIELAMSDLSLDQERLTAALEVIKSGPELRMATQRLRPEEAPVYTTRELSMALGDPRYAFIHDMAEDVIGRPLYKYENQTLFAIYDHLGLSSEVMALLINHVRRSVGISAEPGAPVTVTFYDLRHEAIEWHKRGLTTVDAAETYIKQAEELDARSRECIKLLGLTGKRLTMDERRSIAGLVALDPDFELIMRAYEITLRNTGSLKWQYMRKILEAWNKRGFKTVADVEAGENTQKKSRRAAPPQPPEIDSDYEEQVSSLLKSFERNGHK